MPEFTHGNVTLVVDEDGKVVGRITIDDVVDVMREEAEEDIARMVGTQDEEFDESSVRRIAFLRLPWLLTSLFGGLLAGPGGHEARVEPRGGAVGGAHAQPRVAVGRRAEVLRLVAGVATAQQPVSDEGHVGNADNAGGNHDQQDQAPLVQRERPHQPRQQAHHRRQPAGRQFLVPEQGAQPGQVHPGEVSAAVDNRAGNAGRATGHGLAAARGIQAPGQDVPVGVDRLPEGPLRQLLSGDAIRKAGNVDDLLLGIQELRLSARHVLGLDYQRGQAAVSGGQAGGQSGGPGSDDDGIVRRKGIRSGRDCVPGQAGIDSPAPDEILSPLGIQGSLRDLAAGQVHEQDPSCVSGHHP